MNLPLTQVEHQALASLRATVERIRSRPDWKGRETRCEWTHYMRMGDGFHAVKEELSRNKAMRVATEVC